MTINPHDATWLIVVAMATERINELRAELESETVSTERTTQIRARIRAFKDVLTWADVPEKVESAPITFGL